MIIAVGERKEMSEMKGITCCADCVYYNMKKHKCNRGCSDYPDGKEHFYRDCPLIDVVEKCEYDILQQALEEANEALKDAVQVVRCKDCKHYIPFIVDGYCGDCSQTEYSVEPDGYCNYGERI